MNIETYILNMPQRLERKVSVLQEFEEKTCFSVRFVMPVQHVSPRLSHWLTFLALTKEAKTRDLKCFLFCEDDHIFTADYNIQFFMETLEEAKSVEADVLLGGVSYMKTPIQVSPHLFWLEAFNGTQFVVVFRKFYDNIISCNYDKDTVVTDFEISKLSDNIFVTYPFLSVQKEFVYSDITSFNNQEGYVSRLFEGTSKGLHILYKVKNFYHEL
jgi:glycosyl transferase family 25